jgi:hypothetical protein
MTPALAGEGEELADEPGRAVQSCAQLASAAALALTRRALGELRPQAAR